MSELKGIQSHTNLTRVEEESYMDKKANSTMKKVQSDKKFEKDSVTNLGS
jgi:hypothetical protein